MATACSLSPLLFRTSMIEKTQAIPLRIAPFSRTSHIVTWLGMESGCVTTLVKGACRRNSAFLGQYDLFYTCELLFYSRERNGLHITRDCTAIATRPAFRTDWRAYTAALYAADIVLHSGTRGGSRHQEVFDLLTAFLDALAQGAAPLNLAFWFELKLLQHLGFSPVLDRCARCAAQLTRATAAALSPADGGVLCPACAEASGGVTPDVLAILGRWRHAVSPSALRNTVCSPNQVLACGAVTGRLANYYLETTPEGRDATIAMLRSPHAQFGAGRREM